MGELQHLKNHQHYSKATIDHIIDVVEIKTLVEDILYHKVRETSRYCHCPSPYGNGKYWKGGKSFFITKSRKMFKCFNTGRTGSVVTLAMYLLKLNRQEAIFWLIGKYGIEKKYIERIDVPRLVKKEKLRLSLVSPNDLPF
jgi:DNA primase